MCRGLVPAPAALWNPILAGTGWYWLVPEMVQLLVPDLVTEIESFILKKNVTPRRFYVISKFWIFQKRLDFYKKK